MQRQSHIIRTGIYPRLQQIFSSKKYNIFRAYQRQTADTYLTKIITVKDAKVFKAYKNHIISNVLPYLVQLQFLKLSSQLSIEPEIGQVMVKTQYKEDVEENFNYEGNEDNNGQKLVRKQKDSNTILISKKLVKGMSLREMILNKDKRLDEDFCQDLIGQIVDFLLAKKRVKDLFITTQNIIVEDTGFIYFNYFSFTGLQFIKCDKYITKVQFEEILPYLTPKLIAESSEDNRQTDIEVDLRFILVNFLSAYFKKDLLFDSDFNFDVQMRKDNTKIAIAVEKISRSLLNSVLTKEQKEKIKNYRSNIWKLLKPLNRPQDKGIQKTSTSEETVFSWEDILQNLSLRKLQKNKSSVFILTDPNEKIKVFLSKLNYRQSQNSKFICTVFHNLVDLFIDIIKEVAFEQPKGSSKLKNTKKIILFKNSLVQQRRQFRSSKRFSPCVYIPIKTGMKFSTILKYKNWVNMLQESTSTNQHTLQAVKNLVEFIISIRQSMMDMSPLITQNLLEKVIQTKLEQIKKLAKSQSKDQEQEQLYTEQIPFHQLLKGLFMNENMRQQFWKLFFAIINRMLLLIKKFHQKTTNYKVTQNIEINRQEFRQIFGAIKEYVPPLSPEGGEQVIKTAKEEKSEEENPNQTV